MMRRRPRSGKFLAKIGDIDMSHKRRAAQSSFPSWRTRLEARSAPELMHRLSTRHLDGQCSQIRALAVLFVELLLLRIEGSKSARTMSMEKMLSPDWRSSVFLCMKTTNAVNSFVGTACAVWRLSSVKS